METFGTVLIAVVLVAIVVAGLSYIGSGDIYKGLGRTGMSLHEHESQPGPAAGSPAAMAEAEQEIRQMLEAKSARREARGEHPLDVAAETAALFPGRRAPGRPGKGAHPPDLARHGHNAADEVLKDEVRQLVVAGNERRARRGQEPLDVETEVERRLKELGAWTT